MGGFGVTEADVAIAGVERSGTTILRRYLDRAGLEVVDVTPDKHSPIEAVGAPKLVWTSRHLFPSIDSMIRFPPEPIPEESAAIGLLVSRWTDGNDRLLRETEDLDCALHIQWEDWIRDFEGQIEKLGTHINEPEIWELEPDHHPRSRSRSGMDPHEDGFNPDYYADGEYLDRLGYDVWNYVWHYERRWTPTCEELGYPTSPKELF